MKVHLDGFDLTRVLAAAQDTKEVNQDLERAMRVLGAAEFATSTISVALIRGPVWVTEWHWDWACKNYLCPTGEWPKCDEQEGPRLSDITVFSGYVRKLEALNYPTAHAFAESFDTAVGRLEHMLRSYAHGVQVVESGVFRLQVSTWRARLERLRLI